MRDAAIGNGASVLDPSGAARAGARSDRKDADAGDGAFENVLGRARSGGRADVKGAGEEPSLQGDEMEMPETGQNGSKPTATRAATKPVIDIRIGRDQTGAIGNEAADEEVLPQPATGRRKTVPGKRLTVADASSADALATGRDTLRGAGTIERLHGDIRLRGQGADKTAKLHGDGKAAAADQQAVVAEDALSLLQNTATSGPQVSTDAGDADQTLQVQQEGRTDKIVAERHEPLAGAQLLAPLMQAAVPAGTETSGKPAEAVLDAKKPSTHDEKDATGTDASDSRSLHAARGDEDRIFRFSRADGRGQTLEMTVGAAERNESRRNVPVENVTVLDSRRYLALSPNMTTIASALSGDPEWTSAMQPGAALSNAASQASTGKVVNTLKIQIHPMTLGAVTATMRLAGDELTIDLQVETSAAWRQLNDDQRGLVESLRAQGLSVDQVTVTLVSASDKADTATMQGNGQQTAQDGGASARRDERNAAGQQNDRGGSTRGEEPQNGDPAIAGGRPGHLYL